MKECFVELGTVVDVFLALIIVLKYEAQRIDTEHKNFRGQKQ